MEHIPKLIELGKGMGLTGNELATFVDKREAMLRETEKEKQKLDREERMREREERMKEKEFQLKEKEFAEQEKQALLKIELAQKEIELAKINADSKTAKTVKNPDIKVKIPKLPPFNEGKDNMDSYLKRFERFATNAKWPKEEWATNLSTLLQGKALDVYSRLSSSEATDYDKLCDALLKRYQLTEEGFRQKFRSSKQEVGETAGQFMVRLSNYLSRWMELGKVNETYDSLRDLILREQFLTVSNKNLVLFLKERKIKSVKEMVEFAEQYNEAHSVSDTSYKSSFGNRSEPRSDFIKKDNFKNPVLDGSKQTKVFKERYCYGCGKLDHFVKDCPNPNKTFMRSSPSLKAASLETSEDQNEETGKTETEVRSEIGQSDAKSVATCIVLTPTTNQCSVVQSRCHSDTKVKATNEIEIVSIACNGTGELISKRTESMPIKEGFVGKSKVIVLRDSGCNSVLVKKSLVRDEEHTGKMVRCILADGSKRSFPVATIIVDTPYFVGQVEALCMENPVYDLVIGNIDGVRAANNPDENWSRKVNTKIRPTDNSKDEPRYEVSAVETRAQKQKKETKVTLRVPEPVSMVSIEQLKEYQENDETLSDIRHKASTGETIHGKDGSSIKYFIKQGVYYRHFSYVGSNSKTCKQLIVPQRLRSDVLKTAHDGVMSGHFGIRKTTNKVLSEFYWPKVQRDIKFYCKSCDICQKTVPKGHISKLPLGRMPLIDTPFTRVAIDLIGPIHPSTDEGHRFILTVVDYATRYPEAIALKRIDTESVAEALVEIYSRVGVPREVLSDQGKQFTSDLMKEVSRLLSMKQLTTTPYHPSCNGLVERFNGTLKSMLRKLCEEQPKQWNRFIPALLFAYRDSIQESTGYSPFQLLYGHQVRGPLAILRELWTKEINDEEVKLTYQYVIDLRERIEDTCKMAQEELSKSSKRYKAYADSKAKDRQFQKGNEVLLLLPNDNNKLLMQWKGPFTVVDKISPFDYKINVNGKTKTYHGNMLKRYYNRNESTESKKMSETEKVACVSVIEDGEEEEQEKEEKGAIMELQTCKQTAGKHVSIQFPSYFAKESTKDVQICEDLSQDKRAEIETLILEFADVFTDVPGTTSIVEHEITVTSNQPVRSKQYPVPYSLKKDIKEEIDNMLKLEIIEPCNSPYASPVVMVKKPDGSYRFCCDFRKLNSITVFDAEPIGNPDEIFSKMAQSKYFTKIDLSKGYWQIKMKESSKPLTAFITTEGLFAFRKMPFGLVNSGATFCRMMRILLKGLENTDNFVDDIIVHTETWAMQISCLRQLFERLRAAQLTARPSKCVVAMGRIAFLGHIVGDGILKPSPEKVEGIRKCKRPCTKKQVRSFLGLVGYYRKFIPNFSAISAPLSDLTKNGQPNKIRWEQEQENAFVSLINQLSQSPILCLPNFEKEFILQTDASDTGIGAVLLQEYGGYKFPIYFASKKLLDRERRYSVIEKECLAIVWSIQKFQSYLYGKEFCLETDHRPLIYLNKAKVANARLMRWALTLQPFKMRLESITGTENHGADFLSRMNCEK